jgi:hypothetical protein
MNTSKKEIYTKNPEIEIWNYITDFESKQFLIKFIRERVKILTSRENRTEYNLINEGNSEDIIPEISNNAKQARDFFFMSKQLPLLSKPVMLFYAFEKLAMMLVDLTFQKNKEIISENRSRQKFTHGLSFYPPEPIRVLSSGLFQFLHDCVSSDGILHQKKFSFTFEDILQLGKISYERLSYEIHKGSDSYRLKDSGSDNITYLTELERQFIFIFALSIFSRYRVTDWERILSGEENNLITIIRRYLNSVELLFPNLVLNNLYNKIIYFYSPAELASVEIYDYDTPIDLFC